MPARSLSVARSTFATADEALLGQKEFRCRIIFIGVMSIIERMKTGQG